MTTAGNALVVMAKAPEPGQSKTRLVPPLTFEQAAGIARALLLDQLHHLRGFPGARRFLAFSAAAPGEFLRDYALPEFSPIEQSGSDLGERMSRCFRDLFASGFQRILLIGADLPPVPFEFLNRALRLLDRPELRVVLGPSVDGGYYLIGMNRPVLDVFKGVRWSRDDVLARTLEILAERGINYGLIPFWYDVDTAEDLERFGSKNVPAGPAMKNAIRLLHGVLVGGRLERRAVVAAKGKLA